MKKLSWHEATRNKGWAYELPNPESWIRQYFDGDKKKLFTNVNIYEKVWVGLEDDIV